MYILTTTVQDEKGEVHERKDSTYLVRDLQEMYDEHVASLPKGDPVAHLTSTKVYYSPQDFRDAVDNLFRASWY